MHLDDDARKAVFLAACELIAEHGSPVVVPLLDGRIFLAACTTPVPPPNPESDA